MTRYIDAIADDCCRKARHETGGSAQEKTPNRKQHGTTDDDKTPENDSKAGEAEREDHDS